MYVPIGVIAMVAMMAEVYNQFPEMKEIRAEYYIYQINGGESNITMMGEMIYTWELIMYSGVVLLVAMVGAIVLTISHTQGVKRQDLYRK